MRLIGDVHGKYNEYHRIIEGAGPSVQVGDMGVGFLKTTHDGTMFRVNPSHDKMVKNKARFIRGNHDNPAVCKRQSQYIHDGKVEDGIMFIGGAPSIDREWRTEGFDWWPDEELSENELDRLSQLYQRVKPRAMVTHTCPSSVANAVMIHFRQDRIGEICLTEAYFEQMYAIHQPEVWVFGHWHHSIDFVMNGTNFVCLNELEYRDDLL